MQYQVTHTTEYEYHQPVSICHNVAKLFLRDTSDQSCRKTLIKISPEPEIKNEYTDFFGNKTLYFAIQHEHKHLRVTVTSIIDKKPGVNNAPELFTNTAWEEVQQQIATNGEADFSARQYVAETAITQASEQIRAYSLQSFTPGRSMLAAAKELMQRIHTDFQFVPGFTTVATPLDVVMKERKGVCQDFAHLAIACIRAVGLPARYVSGYLETLPPPGKEKLTGVDASHAWFAVYMPNQGWLDFDPTNNMIPAAQHITIGWGRDYADITPLKGVILSSGPHRLHVSVDVKRLG
ncbi:transglutaminase family protein [Panacibacter sp. DH6]|uniref:Transglutaminase family protein n=1 Tax=Panacibacter microcysteis TaxID=2793269 RepID=A0A931E4A3_9BACT|nr:transglutaminase family protein [Panacibacter microcysteis]MBG9377385.1 transglutaminase family protein [Panacibacter microcysteis]